MSFNVAELTFMLGITVYSEHVFLHSLLNYFSTVVDCYGT